MTKHIMIDIETLDTTARAVVISIGAVAFGFQTGAQTYPFYRGMAYDDQIRMGRMMSQSTLKFWSEQPDEARAAAFGGDRVPTEVVLKELGEFIKRHRDGDTDRPLVWAYPASFDFAILEDLYRDYNSFAPWGHRDRRCARTLYSLAGNPSFSHEGDLIPHHPVSDCQVQITQAIVSVGEIKRLGVNIS